MAMLWPHTTWPYATICEGATFGERCVVGTCAWVGKNVACGDDVRIQHGAFIASGTQIGNRVFIGPNAVLTDDKYPVVNNPSYLHQPPILEDDTSIGAGAVICPGVRIGKGAMVGAGAVVVEDVPSFTTVVGVPAKVLESE
jgi:UDP-2-acetamido-3-amino-2,3-dideoxy-glucuronate N-acetyltransferase